MEELAYRTKIVVIEFDLYQQKSRTWQDVWVVCPYVAKQHISTCISPVGFRKETMNSSL